MPRISAPTVAKHHAQQRAALLRAATDILVDRGATAVTPAAVGAAAGLARSSVYQYFPSSAALLAAIIEEAFPPADAALRTAMARARGPAERIDAYVRETLKLAAAGAHRAAAALSAADVPPACRVRLVELHQAQAAPMVRAVHELGVPAPELTAALIGGLIQAAVRAVDNGAPPRTVTRRTLALIHHGLSGEAG